MLDDALIPGVGRDSFKAKTDVVMEVAMVTIGENVPGLDANVETTNGELLHGHCCITVMWKLEVDEEVFRSMVHHRDVELPDAKLRAESLLDAFWADIISFPTQTSHHDTEG